MVETCYAEGYDLQSNHVFSVGDPRELALLV